MFPGVCLPCCGCPCRPALFEKLRGSAVTIEITSVVPNQIEMTTGYYKVFGYLAAPGGRPQDPDASMNRYTFYKSSDFYKTYTLALDYSNFNCFRNYNGLYNISYITFGYADDNIELTVRMQLRSEPQDGSVPTFSGSPMKKIGSTQCYFGALFQARLYDQTARLDYGQLPTAFSWNKTTRNLPITNSTLSYTQQVWTIEPAPTAWCGDELIFPSTGFWDQNYAPSGISFGRTAYADLGSNEVFAETQMTSATISEDFPVAASCVVPMRRLLPTRFWTTDASKQAPCNGPYQTTTRLGLDSSTSTASGFIQITPPQ